MVVDHESGKAFGKPDLVYSLKTGRFAEDDRYDDGIPP